MKARSMVVTLVVLPSLLAAQQPGATNLIRVPAGTHVQLELINKLSTRASRVGDRVRAQTAFPVSVGNQVAIPAGTFVEGTVEKVSSRSEAERFFMKFDQVTFANGYTVNGGEGKASAQLRMPLGGFGFQAPPTCQRRRAGSRAPEQRSLWGPLGWEC